MITVTINIPNVWIVFEISPISKIFDAINEAIPIGEYLRNVFINFYLKNFNAFKIKKKFFNQKIIL